MLRINSSISIFRREWTPSETIWPNNTFASSADGSSFKHELLGDDIEAVRQTWCLSQDINSSYCWKHWIHGSKLKRIWLLILSARFIYNNWSEQLCGQSSLETLCKLYTIMLWMSTFWFFSNLLRVEYYCWIRKWISKQF